MLHISSQNQLITVTPSIGIKNNQLLATPLFYPNPVTNVATIKFTDALPHSLKIYNIMGQIVLSQVVTVGAQIDLSGLTQGVYLLDCDNNAPIKFVKD